MSESDSDTITGTVEQESAEDMDLPGCYRRDERYYIHTITFLVEDTLFKVPRSGFEGRKESYFEVCDAPNNADQKPLELHVKVGQFRSLLKVIYGNLNELGAAEQDLSPLPTLTDDEWIDALELSDMWCIEDIRAKAVENLRLRVASLGAPKTVDLARQFGIRSLFFAGIERVALRPDHLPLSLLRDKFDLETVVKIYSLRDRYSPAVRALYNEGEEGKLDGNWVTEQTAILVKSKFCDCRYNKVMGKAEALVRWMMRVPQGAPAVRNARELLESLRADIAVVFEEDLKEMS